MLASTRCSPTLEAVVDEQGERRREDATAGDLAVDPVADRRAVEGSANDVAGRHLAGQPAVVGDRQRQGAAGAGLLADVAQHRGEDDRAVPVRPRRRRLRLRPALPRAEPFLVADPDLAPGGRVAQPQRAEPDAPVLQRDRPAAEPSVVAAPQLRDEVPDDRGQHGDSVAHPTGRAGQRDDEASRRPCRRRHGTGSSSGPRRGGTAAAPRRSRAPRARAAAAPPRASRRAARSRCRPWSRRGRCRLRQPPEPPPATASTSSGTTTTSPTSKPSSPSSEASSGPEVS